MRLASFNVLHGRSLADGAVGLERLATACASLEADVLCLQEIDRGQPRSGGADQVAAVAEAVGTPHWRFEPALVGEPGGEWRAAGDADSPPAPPGSAPFPAPPGSAPFPAPPGSSPFPAPPGYGVGIVSRRPVRGWSVVRLAAARVRAPVAVPGGRGRFILLPDEPRVALVAEVEPPPGWPHPLRVATTHLSFVPGHNARQLRRLTRSLEAAGPIPAVVLGDLNLPGPLPAWVTGWRPLARVATYPGDRPRLQLDHALGWGDLPPVAAVAAVALPLSDHRALVVDLGAR